MGDNRLTVINTDTQEPEFEIPLPGVPRPVAMDRGAKHLFVQLSNLHGFVVVDFAARKVTRKILLPRSAAGCKAFNTRNFFTRYRCRPGREDAMGE